MRKSIKIITLIQVIGYGVSVFVLPLAELKFNAIYKMTFKSLSYLLQ